MKAGAQGEIAMTVVPLQRSQSYEPGLPLLGTGLERYPVRGGGAAVIGLAQGDSLEIIDPQGLQYCELAVFGKDGHEDAAALNAVTSGPAKGIAAILSDDNEGARSVAAGLSLQNIKVEDSRAVYLFEGDSRPGETASFTAQRAAVCIIAAPGGAMRPEEQNPPTDLVVMVQRAQAEPKAAPKLPAPLADPRLDFRIERATAQSYEVKAGEFIQGIDVEGRQCSDFLSFATRQLDKGIERGLDATTTRSLIGAAYPTPGLYCKFFDQDMQPLVEVIQDTVGRHDTFNLACTAKYYEDMGYPGHVNCSENFNAALAPFAVAPRKGWPAINFFYNTAVDEQNVLYFREPWSRPGDYVLLRANTDLVCASSACPCDIDPANGWNPTDIHVRVYPEKNSFRKAVAYRTTPDADAQLTRETGFHPRTSELTRNFTEYRGFWLPTSFRDHGAVEEYWACRERAVVLDLSALRKFEVVGPDAESLMQHTLTRDVRKLSVGQVVYSAMCYETGGMLDDGTAFRMAPDNFRWICGDDYCGVWLREQAEKLGLKVWVKSSTDQMHNISVQGPKSREILKHVVWTAPDQPTIEELGWFRFAVGRIGDLNGASVVVSRTGYTGELGYEVWCHPKDAAAVWDAVWAAGEPHGIAPLGLDALDMLRIEAGLIFYGYEFCDQTDPFEAGIGFTVALKTKTEDFIGRESLIRRKENPQRKLVGLELHDNEPAANGDSIHVGRSQVGEITSGTRSPILKKNIALCRIDVTYAGIGSEVEVGKIDGHQKRIPATVVRFPHYDPEKTRVRG
jgi:aminomethyltransferase